MTVRQIVRHLQSNPKDAFYYWQGILRYWIYKRPSLRWLIRWHIRAQFEARKVLAQACYFNGSCICCGCDTPSLFFADKACSAGKKQYRHCLNRNPCYPKLISRTEWYWHCLKKQ